MSAPLPTISMIVLNWNGSKHLAGSLGSIEKLDHPAGRLELIAVDNGSTDGSVEYIRAKHPRWKLVELPANLGFAEGNNRGAATATGEWIGFLNNDMRVEPGWLQALLGGLEACPGAVCLASRILSWDGTKVDFVGGGVNYQGHGFQHDFGRPAPDHDEARRLLFACGGAMLVRRELFAEVGGFDPDYFAYFEDIDLGWRLNLLGHDVWYAPAATAYHHHHSTGGRMEAHRLRVLYERNALLTIYKNLDGANLAAALPAAMLLLNERALLLLRIDRTAFHLGPGGPQQEDYPIPAASEGMLPKAGRVLREEGLATLAAKSAGALRRKLAAPFPGSAGMAVDRIALSHHVALSEFAHALARLNEQRAKIQQTRVRSDAEVLALGGDALHPNWMDGRYLRFYDWLNKVQGLDHRFRGGQQ